MEIDKQKTDKQKITEYEKIVSKERQSNRMSNKNSFVDKGIVAITFKNNKVFFFNTPHSEEVETAMCNMGFGCSEYYLSLGICISGLTRDSFKQF